MARNIDRGVGAGIYRTVADMQAAGDTLKEFDIIRVFENKTEYYISTTDEGEGLVITGTSLFANAPEISATGGSMPINSMAQLVSAEVKVTTESGEEWLQTGYLETDVASYPLANKIYSLDNRNATLDWSTSSAGAGDAGLDFDGTFFWVGDAANARIHKFNSDGTSASESITLSSSVVPGTETLKDIAIDEVTGDKYVLTQVTATPITGYLKKVDDTWQVVEISVFFGGTGDGYAPNSVSAYSAGITIGMFYYQNFYRNDGAEITFTGKTVVREGGNNSTRVEGSAHVNGKVVPITTPLGVAHVLRSYEISEGSETLTDITTSVSGAAVYNNTLYVNEPASQTVKAFDIVAKAVGENNVIEITDNTNPVYVRIK